MDQRKEDKGGGRVLRLSNTLKRGERSVSQSGVRPKLAGLMARQRPQTSGRSVQVGLIGRGIGASLTPVMHRREGERLGLDYSYVLIDFDGLGLADGDLGTVIASARDLGFAGLNVTYPFKQQVIGLLNALSDEARMIGAVNTVVFDQGKARGHNTDCWGFAESFRARMEGAAIGSVLQLGAGGAGAAVAQALLGLGAGHLAILDVDADRAAALCGKLDRQFPGRVSLAERADAAIAEVDGVVNTSPVGMTKLPGMPFAPELLDPAQWYADIIYFPRETALLVAARARGCRVLPGSGMAVFQAVKAFELFSGQTPDAGEMSRTFRAEA